MKKQLLIIGASGHGKVVADIANRMNRWEKLAFLDDNEAIQSELGIDVIGNPAEAEYYLDDYDIFIAIGNNEKRKRIQEELEDKGATIPVLVHPSAVIGPEVTLGTGSVVIGGAVINCSTHIGKGCIVNTGATVGHDNYISDYVHVSSGCHIAGTVTVETLCWLGIGSVISNNLRIHERCTLGAGAVVPKDLTEPGVYVGVPAKKVK